MRLQKINILILFLILAAFISSYVKETLFEIINYLLLGQTGNYANTSPPGFLLQADAKQLVFYKWIFLALNIFVINAINLFFLFITRQKSIFKLYLLWLIAFIVLAVISLGLSRWGGKVFVEISRVIQQIIESPLILLGLILQYYFPDFLSKKQLNEP